MRDFVLSLMARVLRGTDGFLAVVTRLIAIFTICATIAVVLFGGSTGAVAFGAIVLVVIAAIRRVVKHFI